MFNLKNQSIIFLFETIAFAISLQEIKCITGKFHYQLRFWH